MAWNDHEPITARGAPNVLFIVLDTGCGHLGCYGSPISTPNLDRLARAGLRFTNMQTTALCSPSRSCIITGRNHHGNPLGSITSQPMLDPERNRKPRLGNGFLSEILLGSGYRTFALGIGQPGVADRSSSARSELVPLARGFERFYEGHHTPDLVDHAIEFVAEAKLATPDRPFFMYLCAGRNDASRQGLERWAEKYEGRFDDGWDAYQDQVFRRQLEMGLVAPSTRPRAREAGVAEWCSLSDDEKRAHARRMEIFAGSVEHTDYQMGRLLDYLDCTGQLDNTLIMVVSDDTRSAEEWSFRTWRGAPRRGAASDPFIVHWPRGISRPGAIRHQYAHVIDMVPTVLEALELEPPTHLSGVPQSPIQGISFAQAFRSNAQGGKRLQAEAPRKRPASSARTSAVTTEAPAQAGI